MIQLFVTDLDGTLLANSKGDIHAENVAAIKAWTEAGHIFAIASGRNPKEIQQIVAKHQLENVFCVGSNGALIITADNTLLAEHTMDYGLVSQIMPIARKHTCFRMAGSFSNYYIENRTLIYRLYEWYHGMKNIGIKKVEQLENDGIDIAKLLFTGQPKHLASLKKELDDHFIDAIDCYFSVPQCLEIMPKNVHKGTGVTLLAQSLHIPLTQVSVIGDGENDVPMFTIGATSFGMREGIPSAVQHADHLVNTVAEAIHYKLSEKIAVEA
ncbi:MAG: HAD family hydrolase [Bacilli bacterium]